MWLYGADCICLDVKQVFLDFLTHGDASVYSFQEIFCERPVKEMWLVRYDVVQNTYNLAMRGHVSDNVT